MDDRHLSVELLQAIHCGERSPGDLAAVAMAHLFEKCAQCRSVFEAWRQSLDEDRVDPLLERYDSAFDRVKARLRTDSSETEGGLPSLEALVSAETRDAHQLLQEILARPMRERRELIRKNGERYSGPVLAALLLEQAWDELPGRPRDSHSWAGLARAVLHHSSATPYAAELYARAIGLEANALRAQGELRPAAELIDVARYLLKSQGGGDVLTRAELDRFEGSLRRAQRRFDEARDFLSRAVMAYALEGQKEDAAATLLALGPVLQEMGDLDKAVDAAAQALEIAQDEGLRSLELFARHNLAFSLHQAGENAEARRIFDESQDLYEQQDNPPIQLRRVWLHGHLARAEGDLSEAEMAYRTVKEGFFRQGIGYHAALAALDLAKLYAQEGRTADLKRIAEEIVPIFEAQDVHREAAAALMLFQDAVKAEQVTLRYLIELSRYLERARLDPSLVFQQPA